MNKIRIYVACRIVSVESTWQEFFFPRATAKVDRKINLYPYKLSLLVTLINDLPGQKIVAMQAVLSKCCLASQQSCREQPERQCMRGAPRMTEKTYCPENSFSLLYTLITRLLSLGQPSRSKNKSIHCHKHRAYISVSQGSSHPCPSAVTPVVHVDTTADMQTQSGACCSKSIPLPHTSACPRVPQRWRDVQSVSHTAEPSLGQNRLSVFFLPNCSSWGSESCARHV